MEETIIDNIRRIQNSTLITYCFFKKNFEILNLITSFTADDIINIIYRIFAHSVIRPSNNYIYNLNFNNLYECYEFIIDLSLENIQIFLEAIDKKDYSVYLSDTDYNIWIKEYNFVGKKPVTNIINLIEYIEMYYEQDSINFFNNVIRYYQLRKNIVKNKIIWKYFDKIVSPFVFTNVLEMLAHNDESIDEYIPLNKMCDIFETFDVKLNLDTFICEYLCKKYDTDFFYKYEKKRKVIEDKFPKNSLATSCLNFNSDNFDNYEEGWNYYYNLSITNSKLGYSDNFLLYNRYYIEHSYLLSEHKILYLPPETDWFILTPDIIGEICEDITQFSDILHYVHNTKRVDLTFSSLYDRYQVRFLESLKYLSIPRLMKFDINMDDPIINTLYNITKRDDILCKIIKYWTHS